MNIKIIPNASNGEKILKFLSADRKKNPQSKVDKQANPIKKEDNTGTLFKRKGGIEYIYYEAKKIRFIKKG